MEAGTAGQASSASDLTDADQAGAQADHDGPDRSKADPADASNRYDIDRLDPDAYPNEMLARLIGPGPAELVPVDTKMSLTEALAAHPALEDIPAIAPLPTYLDRSLSQVVQAHGSLTALLEAASTDPVARDLIPYAAARLSTVSRTNAPAFETAALLNTFQQDAEIRLTQSNAAPVHAEDLSAELTRLSRLLEIPTLQNQLPAEVPETPAASLVAALNNVLSTTRAAQAVTHLLPALQKDAQLAHQALEEGFLSPAQAQSVSDATELAQRALLEPVQARLDAIHALSATASAVAPLMAPAAVTEPVFVDPLGLIVVMGEGDDEIRGGNMSGGPLPQVGPLFPSGSLLIVETGGDDEYTDVAFADNARRILRPTEQGVGVDDEAEPVAETLEQADETGIFFVDQFLFFEAGSFLADNVRDHTEDADNVTKFEADVAVPQPVSLVIDLAGNDTYRGERTGHSAGAATTAIVDHEGDDTYNAGKGLGFVQLDGLSLLLDHAGDDDYTVTEGLGAVGPATGDEIPMNTPTLAAFVDTTGNDTYNVKRMGAGVSFINTTIATRESSGEASRDANFYRAHAMAFDLADGADGFGPMLDGNAINPTVEFTEDRKGEARYWEEFQSLGRYTVGGGASLCLTSEREICFPSGVGGGLSDGYQLGIRALERNWLPDVAQISNGTLTQHNTSLTTGSIQGPIAVDLIVNAVLFSFTQSLPPVIQDEVHIPDFLHADFTNVSHVYEEPYPAILIDAAGSETYINASTNAGMEVHQSRLGHLSIPNTVIDVAGNDAYVGRTAHIEMDTPPDNEGTAGIVVTDLAGDDRYEGNLSSVRVNKTDTDEPRSVVAFVYDANGTDTYDAPDGMIAGMRIEDMHRPEGGSATAMPALTTALLLDGGTQPNSFRAKEASLGGILLDPREVGGVVQMDGFLLSGALVTGPSTYELGTASLGAVSWDGCLALTDGTCQDIPLPGSLALTALFVGSAQSDRYTVSERPALGEAVTGDAGAPSPQGMDACDTVGGTQFTFPSIITRFVDIGGADTYEYERTDRALPPWTNDADWDGVDCGEQEGAVRDCDETFADAVISLALVRSVVCSEDVTDTPGYNFVTAAWQSTRNAAGIVGQDPGPNPVDDVESPVPALYRAIRPTAEDLPVGLGLVQSASDTKGIDNVASWAVGSTTSAAGALADGDIIEEIDVIDAEICVGNPHETVQADGTALLVGNLRCGKGPTITERDHFAIRSDLEVPVTLLDQLEPCDAGRTGTDNGTLGTRIRDTNVPSGNPRAHGLSGCWATLEIHFDQEASETRFQAPLGDGIQWTRRIANATEDMYILEGEVSCSLVDDTTGGTLSIVPVSGLSCSTDAFPLPHHVDGTGGHEAGRVLLPEGQYTYNLTFRGPLELALGRDAELSGGLTIDYEDPFSQPVRSNLNSPVMTWLEEQAQAGADTTEHYWEHVYVRAVSQQRGGDPDQVEIWSPVVLEEEPRLRPVVEHQGTVYAPGPSDTPETTWNQDLGLWMTTYELRENDALTHRFGFDPTGPDVPLVEGANEVRISLLHGFTLERSRLFELPEDRVSDTLTVDNADPEITISPFNDDVPDPAGGLAQLSCPVDGETLFDRVASGQVLCFEMELPIQALDDTPLRSMAITGLPTWDPDAVDLNSSNRTTVPDWNDTLLPGASIIDSQGNQLECAHNETQVAVAPCEIRMNRTFSGLDADGQWNRSATLNLSFNFSNSGEALRGAISRAVNFDEPFRLLVPGSVVASDDAGNRESEGLGSLLIDLRAPEDLLLACGGLGTSTVTDEATTELLYYALSDDMLGLYLETRELGDEEWTRHEDAFVPLDELEHTDRFCEPSDDDDWYALEVNGTQAVGIEPGEQAIVQVRTVALDEAGNEEDASRAFEAVITFDLRDPTLSTDQVHVTPSSTTLEVQGDEAIRITSAEVDLEGDRTRQSEQLLPTSLAPKHTLTFNRLQAATTYPLTIQAVDEAGHRVTLETNLTTAQTLNLTLTQAPAIAGDEVELAWTAGALGPVDGGDPGVLIQLTARQDGEVCAERSVPSFISAPLDAPATERAKLSLLDCPGGELTLEAVFTNTLESVTLSSVTIHDVEPPEPGRTIEGPISESGWYTGAVTIVPTGEDDASKVDAKILWDGHELKRLTLTRPGVHQVTVQATDEAGRSETRTFEVPIDLHPPSVQLVPLDPIPVERPVLGVRVDAVDDASGIRSVRTQAANGTWGPWFPVLEDITMNVDVRGIDVLVAEAIDRAGHTTRVTLPLNSLLEPPKMIQEALTATGPGTIRADIEIDRPLPLTARAVVDDKVVATATSPAAELHALDLHPVPPGSEVHVEIDAKLEGGQNQRLTERTLQTPQDTAPPSSPQELTWSSRTGGVILLEWPAAADDSGIREYAVERSSSSGTTVQVTNETRLLDDPEPGTTHTYRVQARDLTGKISTWSAPIEVTNGAETRLAHYAFTPRIATEGEPVEVRLLVQAAQRPDQVALHLGEDIHPLHLEGGTPGRWLYTSTVNLPATDLFNPSDVRFNVDGELLPENGTLPGPVVQASALNGDDSMLPVPSLPATLAVLLAGLVAVVSRRRWDP